MIRYISSLITTLTLLLTSFAHAQFTQPTILQPAPITLYILTPTGQPDYFAQFKLIERGRQEYAHFKDSFAHGDDIADADGSIAFTPLNEPYQLVITSPHGYLTINHNDITPNQSHTLKPWKQIKGKLTNKNHPLPGITVNVECLLSDDKSIKNRSKKFLAEYKASTFTQADGSFTLNFVPDIPVDIRFNANLYINGYRTNLTTIHFEKDLPPNRFQNINVNLPGAIAYGRILKHDHTPLTDYDWQVRAIYNTEFPTIETKALKSSTGARFVAYNIAPGTNTLQIYIRHRLKNNRSKSISRTFTFEIPDATGPAPIRIPDFILTDPLPPNEPKTPLK
ncbi:hypothetical protein JD969_14425 [Planctomycetota bacterium]|nr:hypothetical protein JD969_14425 [Planctomycetota bacterium]